MSGLVPEVDVHHVVSREQCEEQSYDNLITPCPNRHRRADAGEVDRKALTRNELEGPAGKHSGQSPRGLPAPRRRPGSPGLNSKRLRTTEPIYSVRASRDYRAPGIKEEDTTVRFWIGSHAEYDDLLSRMK